MREAELGSIWEAAARDWSPTNPERILAVEGPALAPQRHRGDGRPYADGAPPTYQRIRSARRAYGSYAPVKRIAKGSVTIISSAVKTKVEADSAS